VLDKLSKELASAFTDRCGGFWTINLEPSPSEELSARTEIIVHIEAHINGRSAGIILLDETSAITLVETALKSSGIGGLPIAGKSISKTECEILSWMTRELLNSVLFKVPSCRQSEIRLSLHPSSEIRSSSRNRSEWLKFKCETESGSISGYAAYTAKGVRLNGSAPQNAESSPLAPRRQAVDLTDEDLNHITAIQRALLLNPHQVYSIVMKQSPQVIANILRFSIVPSHASAVLQMLPTGLAAMVIARLGDLSQKSNIGVHLDCLRALLKGVYGEMAEMHQDQWTFLQVLQGGPTFALQCLQGTRPEIEKDIVRRIEKIAPTLMPKLDRKLAA